MGVAYFGPISNFWYCMHNVVKIPLMQAIYEVYTKLCRLNEQKQHQNMILCCLLGQTWYWISQNKNLAKTGSYLIEFYMENLSLTGS